MPGTLLEVCVICVCMSVWCLNLHPDASAGPEPHVGHQHSAYQQTGITGKYRGKIINLDSQPTEGCRRRNLTSKHCSGSRISQKLSSPYNELCAIIIDRSSTSFIKYWLRQTTQNLEGHRARAPLQTWFVAFSWLDDVAQIIPVWKCLECCHCFFQGNTWIKTLPIVTQSEHFFYTGFLRRIRPFLPLTWLADASRGSLAFF